MSRVALLGSSTDHTIQRLLLTIYIHFDVLIGHLDRDLDVLLTIVGSQTDVRGPGPVRHSRSELRTKLLYSLLLAVVLHRAGLCTPVGHSLPNTLYV